MSAPYYSDDKVTLYHGDCLDVLRGMPDASVHAVVTDPPYGLEFMGKGWDAPWQETGINTDAGFKGGGVSATKGAPSFTSSTNPNCLNCGGKQRGRRDGTAIVAVCTCDAPRFPNTRAVEMRAFQDWCEAWSRECLRVLKPGGHLLAFGGSRTWHRLTVAIEDAGFEIRDSIAWMYGSGFPKSLDVSKAIDKVNGEGDRLHKFTAWMRTTGLTAAQLNAATGTFMGSHYLTAGSQPAIPTAELWRQIRPLVADVPPWVDQLVERIEAEREVVGTRKAVPGVAFTSTGPSEIDITAPATPDAERWQGWGTALKPSHEPVVVARKPLSGTVAANVLAHGTGALNIDGCRVGTGGQLKWSAPRDMGYHGGTDSPATATENPAGRWPANVILDDDAAAEVDRQSGTLTSGKMLAGTRPKGERTTFGRDVAGGYETTRDTPGDSGGASRFFPVFKYEPKAPTTERPRDGSTAHPTVKPLDLMRWLVRLVTPPGGTVLDPFAGSGTTAEACIIEGFPCIVIERETDYLPLIIQRVTKPIAPVLDLGSLA